MDELEDTEVNSSSSQNSLESDRFLIANFWENGFLKTSEIAPLESLLSIPLQKIPASKKNSKPMSY